jgi:hypothetical protein
LVACGTSPTAEQAAAFGKTAVALSSAYTEAGSLEVDLLTSRNAEQAACSYMAGGAIALPAKAVGKLSPDFAERVAFVASLVAYSEALSKATDPAISTELQAAASNLAKASSAFVASAGGLVGVPVAPAVAPALQLSATIGSKVADENRRQQIRAIVQAAENPLFAGATKLIQDLENDKAGLRASFKYWQEAKRCSLLRMREAGASSEQLHEAYVLADLEARNFTTRLKLLDKVGTGLAALMKAHKALLSDEPDLSENLTQFQSITQKIGTLKEAS